MPGSQGVRPKGDQVAALGKWLEERYRGRLWRELRLLEVGLEAADPAVRDLAEERLARMLTPFPPRSWDQVARPLASGLEPLVLHALGHPDAGVRALAVDLFGEATRYLESPGALPPLAALLSDPAEGLALAAARRLWLCSRPGADLEPVLPEIEEGRRSAVENVPFFCALALAHHQRRQGRAPPPIPAPRGRPDLGGSQRVSGGWSAQARQELPEGNGIDRYVAKPPPANCCACGEPGATFVFYDSEGSNAGGIITWGYRCGVCGLYTLEEQEWG